MTDHGIGFDPAKLVATSEAGADRVGVVQHPRAAHPARRAAEDREHSGAWRRLRADRTARLRRERGGREDLERHAAGGATFVGTGRPRFLDPLRILIVDDHAAVRKVLRETLHRWPELRVVGEAANGVEAIVEVEALRPEVVLMDISMPLMDGITATRQLSAAYPSVRILGLSMQQRPDGRHPIEEAGAAGFFVKGVDTQRLIDQLLEMQDARRDVAE